MPLGTVGLPGPGFFPLVLGVLLALAALGVIARLTRVPLADRVTIGHREVLLTFLALLCVPLLFERLGAVPTLAAFIAASVMIIGRVAWWRAVIGAAIG